MNNDFKYFIRVGSINTRAWGGRKPPHIQFLILNFKLTSPNICFVPHSFISNTEYLLVYIRWMQPHSGKIRNLSSKITNNIYKSRLISAYLILTIRNLIFPLVGLSFTILSIFFTAAVIIYFTAFWILIILFFVPHSFISNTEWIIYW